MGQGCSRLHLRRRQGVGIQSHLIDIAREAVDRTLDGRVGISADRGVGAGARRERCARNGLGIEQGAARVVQVERHGVGGGRIHHGRDEIPLIHGERDRGIEVHQCRRPAVEPQLGASRIAEAQCVAIEVLVVRPDPPLRARGGPNPRGHGEGTAGVRQGARHLHILGRAVERPIPAGAGGARDCRSEARRGRAVLGGAPVAVAARIDDLSGRAGPGAFIEMPEARGGSDRGQQRNGRPDAHRRNATARI